MESQSKFEDASRTARGNIVAKILHRIFSKEQNQAPYKVPPADTPYEYAFPFSAPDLGQVDSASSLIETRESLRRRGAISKLVDREDG